jgi:hypothetical protein
VELVGLASGEAQGAIAVLQANMGSVSEDVPWLPCLVPLCAELFYVLVMC